MLISRCLRPLAAIAIVFGALTVVSGGRALFGGADAAAAVGNAMPVVLWFNFLTGFAHVLTGAAWWRHARWAPWASVALAALKALVAAVFPVHVMNGAGPGRLSRLQLPT